MEQEKIYEYVEEADNRSLMELLDTVVNRFRELYEDRELIVITLTKGEGRQEELECIIQMMRESL